MRVFYKGRCVDYTQGFHRRERWYAGGRGEGGGGGGGVIRNTTVQWEPKVESS